MKPTADDQSNSRLMVSALRNVESTIEKHNVKLNLKVTRIDGDQCETVPTGYFVFWSGPYPSAEAAKEICNRLGWKTASDWRYCFGRTIDENYKGKKHIRPDGTYW
jgi:hypothetical protein